MTAEAKKIFERALALPEQERSALIDALADSIVGADDDLSPEWKAEIARRIEAVPGSGLGFRESTCSMASPPERSRGGARGRPFVWPGLGFR